MNIQVTVKWALADAFRKAHYVSYTIVYLIFSPLDAQINL